MPRPPRGEDGEDFGSAGPSRAQRNGAGSDDRTDECRQSAGQNAKAQYILGPRKGVGSSGKTVDQVASEQRFPSIARSDAQGTQQRLGRQKLNTQGSQKDGRDNAAAPQQATGHGDAGRQPDHSHGGPRVNQ